MAIELITGRAGAPHVDSADVGAFNAAMFGGGAYVIEGCEATLTDANHVLVSAGELLCEGRHVRITGAGETLTIDNGLSGYKRNDIVAMRYERNSSDIETCSLVVIKGNQDTGAAQDPPMPTSGKLLEGAASVYWPLYRIVVDGLTPQTPNFIAQRQALYQLGIGTEIPAGADLNDYTTPGNYYCPSGAVAETLSNAPANPTTTGGSKSSFLMKVFLSVDGTYATQEINYGGGSDGLACTRRSKQGKDFSGQAWHWFGGIDSIVAEGTSGIWNWIKFANGFVICRGTTNDLANKKASANGTFFSTDNITISLPFYIKSMTPMGTASRRDIVSCANYNSDDSAQSWFYASVHTGASGTTSSDYRVRFLVTGFWK